MGAHFMATNKNRLNRPATLRRTLGDVLSQEEIKNNWYTPSSHIELARRVLGEIDLDPASCPIANRTVKARQFYTKKQNGLSHPWAGKVWLNPPFSDSMMKHFTEKILSELPNISAAIVLTANHSDTIWFHSLLESSDAFCLVRGRIDF
jgi:hypothetical protein